MPTTLAFRLICDRSSSSDTTTLAPHFHEAMEAEANYGAGRLLFMADRFRAEAMSSTPSLELFVG